MKYLKIIWNFINSKLFGYILIGLAVFLLINMFSKNTKLKNESERKGRNIEVLNESIKTEKLKNGKLQVSIGAYESHAKELEQYNKELAADVKAEKGKVITYSNIIFKLKQDSADLQKAYNELLAKFNKPVKVNDSTWNMDWTLPFIYDSLNYDIYYGRTQIGLSGSLTCLRSLTVHQNKTWLLNRDSQMKMSWGQKYEKGKLKVFAKTSHPAFKATLLEGVYVNYPEKNHWFTGFGIGPELGIGYDFVNNNKMIFIGLGLHYNIYNW